MASTLSLPDRWPMTLTDQRGAAVGYAWFPPGTPTDPAHVLPAAVYAEVCRIAGEDPSSLWVVFKRRSVALSAVVAAEFAAGMAAGR
jgi:hypothetical protein